MIKVENLTKKFTRNDRDFDAVRNVSLEVKKGEFAAIIGHSGSGKTTLFNMIAGLIAPLSGKIYIDGTEISDLNNDKMAIFRRRQLGLIYQFYNLIPILNVEENIALPCRLDGKQVEKEKMEEMLSTLNLTNRRKHLPNQLSGGQQQRVSIGRALINHPAIVLADEPTGNLDSKASGEIIDLLKMTNRKYDQTILLITHDEKIALEADRIITIADGKIIKDEKVR